MKLLPVLICIILYANIVLIDGVRDGHGLSPEQLKFIKELNEDRKRLAKELDFDYDDIFYNQTLAEFPGSSEDCNKTAEALVMRGVPLKMNSVAHELKKLEKNKGTSSLFDKSYIFYLPHYKAIGCSKTFKCSQTLQEPPQLAGKTAEIYGLCVLKYHFNPNRKESDDTTIAKLKKADLPPLSKYADILGVEGPAEPKDGATNGNGLDNSGSGRVLNLIVSF